MTKKKVPGFMKPGRGVERNEKKKNAFFRFFELLLRKIYKLFLLNIIYFICVLPLICAMVVAGVQIFQVPADMVQKTIILNWILRSAIWIPTPIGIALAVISGIFYGPLTCGFTYILRNFVNEKHAWMSDFFSRAKANFKQGIVLGLIDILVFTSFGLYLGMNIEGLHGNMLFYFYTFLKFAAIVITIFYIFMRYYLYTLAVTFELNLKAIYKNAYLFAVLGFGRNILVTVINCLSIIAFTSTPYIDIFLTVTLIFTFCGFLAMFATFPIVNKYMLNATEKPIMDDAESDSIEN